MTLDATRDHDWRAAWRHAFAVEPAEGLSAGDAAFLDRVAEAVAGRGMTAPALLFLETLRPLNFVGSQFVLFAAPLLDALWIPEERRRLAALLERRCVVEELMRRLEVCTARTGERV